MIHFPHHFPHYFKQKLSLPLEELYLTAAMMDFASAAITLFEPIYLWTLGYRIPQIMLFYFMVYGAYYFLLPLGGKFVARVGPQQSISLSTIWLVAYIAALVGIASNGALFFVAPLLFALQKTFYWPAYHFEFMRFSVRQERGSEFSGLWTVTTMMYVLGPIVAGVIIKFFGFPPLFIGAAVIILFSSAPLFHTPPAPKRETYSYWQSFLLPWRQRYRRSTAGYLGTGEELIGLTVWPIFILLIYGNVLSLGLLVGASALLTSIATLAAGKWADRSQKKRMLSTSSLIQAGLWLVRLFVRHPASAFAVDTAGRSIHNAVFVSQSAITYDRAHQDDYSWHGVYYEQGYALGKSLMAAVIMILASLIEPFQASFVMAALFSLFYTLF
ncbi:MAG: MFS transporter [Candidatus Kerfeldbacteria bacterium]|nr:MFS transporter [Candidatus Kerfeldbacteria bacterium]